MIVIIHVAEMVDQHSNVLGDLLECQYGLLDHLHGVLTLAQAANVNEHAINRPRQNKLLLDILRKESAIKTHKHFLVALRNTYQKHLAAYVELNGGRPTSFENLNSCTVTYM